MSYLRGLGNLLLARGTLGLKSAERIKTRDNFLITCRPVLNERPWGTAATSDERLPQPFNIEGLNKDFGYYYYYYQY